MSTQTTSRQPSTEDIATEIVDAPRDRRDVDGHREMSRSRSTRVPPTRAQTATLPQPSYAGRPCGHVVGHGIGVLAGPSFAARPCGHVVGHGIGVLPGPSFAARPRGHVVGHGIGVLPGLSFAACPRGHVVGKAPLALMRTTNRKAA